MHACKINKAGEMFTGFAILLMKGDEGKAYVSFVSSTLIRVLHATDIVNASLQLMRLTIFISLQAQSDVCSDLLLVQ